MVERAEAVIYRLLSEDHAIRVLAGARIYADKPAQDAGRALLIYRRIGTEPMPSLSGADAGMRGVEVEVVGYARTFALASELMQAVEARLHLYQELPLVGGIFLEGEDGEETDQGYARTQTYRVMLDETG